MKLCAPRSPGVYRATFKLFHSGNVVFGEEARLHVVVALDSTASMAYAVGSKSTNTILRKSLFDESCSSAAAREDDESEGPKNMRSDIEHTTMSHDRYVARVSSSQEQLSQEEK